MMDLYCIGELLIDFLPGEAPGTYIQKAGGAPANVAVAAAKCGCRAAMRTCVGADAFGTFLLETLKNYGVAPLCETPCKDAVTTMAFVSLTEAGERQFTFARKPGADAFLSASDIKKEEIADAIIVHAGSFSLSAEPAAGATKKALALAKELGCLVSFDVNYRDLVWNADKEACAAAVKEILPFVDLLKISDEEVDLFGGSDALPDLIEKYDIAVLAETLGAKGARAFVGGAALFAPANKVQVADTTGAGDAFWGAFLAGLRREGIRKNEDISALAVERALAVGNRAAGLCVQKKGAMEALPTEKELFS